jgi:hypothetical protein
MTMGRILSRALEAAGLADYQTKVLSGAPLEARELARLQDADLLLVAGLADSMRAYFRGEEVRVLKKREAREAGVLEFAEAPSPDGKTGADLLRELSLLRLRTAPSTSIAVSMETLGLELAQTALLFGADTLIGDLHSDRTLPLLDGASARRRELEGLVARSGRRASFAEEPELGAEQTP